MKVDLFLTQCREAFDIDFYTGVPDSQLKALCDTLFSQNKLGKDHIVAANEGAAIGLAAGHYLATGRPALVYMQNSGLGNAVNPVASLLDKKVYGIPCVMVIGWRGEPDIKDEPQHAFQGEITLGQLKLLGLPYLVLSAQTTEEEFAAFLQEAKEAVGTGRSIAFVVRKDGLTNGAKALYPSLHTLSREAALEQIVRSAGENAVFVSTTGKTSRELFEIRERLGQAHDHDFLTVGSMGHASMIALGIALEQPEVPVFCLDGDGAALMHMGNLAVVARTKQVKMVHVLLNNQAHESVGGMPVAYGELSFAALAMAAGYEVCLQVSREAEIPMAIEKAMKSETTCFVEVFVSLGSRKELGRPTMSPAQNKVSLMEHLNGMGRQG